MNLKRFKKKSNIIYQLSLSFLGLLIVFLIGLPLINKIKQRNEIKKEIIDLQKEIRDLEEKNSKLEKIVSYLESDQFIEEQARLKLGLKKPGEEVVVIDDKKKNKQNSATDTLYNISGLSKREKSKNFYQNANPLKWFKYFFKNKIN